MEGKLRGTGLHYDRKRRRISYAKAWNTLDCSEFFELLTDDCHYSSQYVFEELESKQQIKENLTGKMQTVKNSGSKVRAELGKILTPDPGRACVLMYQGEGDQVAAVVVFQVREREGLVKRFDLCMPELFEV